MEHTPSKPYRPQNRGVALRSLWPSRRHQDNSIHSIWAAVAPSCCLHGQINCTGYAAI